MQSIANISTRYIPVLNGAPEALVSKRELRTKYETNREIKTWSVYFLLKSLTSSGLIKNYPKQLDTLSAFCRCNKKTLQKRLEELQQLKLIEINGINIHLCAFVVICPDATTLIGISLRSTFKLLSNLVL